MTKIFLLGTFHFSYSQTINFYTAEAQAQLDALVAKLAAFHPSKIAVEVAAHAQPAIDAAYARFTLADLADYEKMKTQSLGNIHLFGGTHPIPYNQEGVQVAFRLAKSLAHPGVFAVDDDSTLPDGIETHFDASQKQRNAAAMANMQYHGPAGDIQAMYDFYNTPAWSRNNQQHYLISKEVHTDGTYTGPDYNAQWYKRNLRIFSNLQNLAKSTPRIFVLYGAGHLHLLQQLIQSSNDMELIPYSDLF